jgi:hypothetical protein
MLCRSTNPGNGYKKAIAQGAQALLLAKNLWSDSEW